VTSQRLDGVRAEARPQAEGALGQLGFQKRGDDTWAGALAGLGSISWSVRVVLPDAFPDTLPEVFVEGAFGGLAHIDPTGKVCIAPSTGVLLDTKRPADLVADAIQRATRILSLSPEEHKRDRLQEFNAYWPQPPGMVLSSICPVPLIAGEICIAEVTGSTTLHLAASDIGSAEMWAHRTLRRVARSYSAFAMPLAAPIDPPTLGEIVALGQARRAIRRHLAADVSHALDGWLKGHGLPATILMSQPVPPDGDSVVFAARLPAPRGDNAKRWEHGFRRGRAPLSRQIAFAAREPVERWAVDRVDAPFIVKRGGGNPELLLRRVAVIGCGAVGSPLAIMLGASGVGGLYLVDCESLAAVNLQRHELGAADLGRRKVEGLQALLHAKYPHVEVTVHHGDVLSLLSDRPDAFDGFSLVVVALGDETLERRFNDLLRDRVPRVHVWLEPLGIGGHTLATGIPRKRGCYGCLFRDDPKFGLVNMSSFVEPGQDLQRTFAGCAGVFTPFGIADAHRAAAEASRQVVRMLRGEVPDPELTSWQGPRDAFLAAGAVLSSRGKAMIAGSSETQLLNGYGCNSCGDG
jgi:molybdopterin/thiamine biosynthesis adenylyltransferase